MKFITTKAYLLFFITAIYLLSASLYSEIKFGGSALDINVHDTYFVIDNLYITFVLFTFYTVLGFLYFTFLKLKINLIKWLTVSHTILTVGAIIVYKIFSNFVFNQDSNFPLFDNSQNLEILRVILILVVSSAQILFIFNLLLSSIRNYKKRHKS